MTGDLFNEDLEVAPLASVLQNKESYSIIEDLIDVPSFWYKPFGLVWKSFQNLANEQLTIDRVSLANDMLRNNTLNSLVILSTGQTGKEAIEYLFSYSLSVGANAETYAHELIEACASRDLSKMTDGIQERINAGERVSSIISFIDEQSGKITTAVGSKSNNLVSAKEAVKDSISATMNAMEGRGVITKTNLKFIDYFVGGLARKRVIMIAGGTGDGKSALLSSIINTMTIENKVKHKMGWISLEMDRRECINRIISNQTGISALRLDTGKITKDELAKYIKWCEIIEDAPILIDDSSELTYPLLKSKIRKMSEAGCVSIGIDQLELLTVPPSMMSMPDHVRYNWGSYRLKAWAKEFDVNILLLHQISREINKGNNRGKDVTPVAQDVSSGGDKGVDSVFIIRHNKEEKKTYLNCVKNRQGISGQRLPVNYIGEKMRFEDCPDISPDVFVSEVPTDVMSDFQDDFVNEQYNDEIMPTQLQ